MASSSCRYSVKCMDSHMPVRATYVNLYKWPQSDAEFVKSVMTNRKGRQVRRATTSNNNNSPDVVDSYSCRQLYLRSYTFSRKESVKERTRRYLVKVKKRAGSIVPYVNRRLKKRSSSRCSFSVVVFGCIYSRVVSCGRSAISIARDRHSIN